MNFDYDIFVSFAGEDFDFVRDHLMPELEGTQNLRLCVHERDFIPGRNIVDNIVEAVESSKKVVLYLHYLSKKKIKVKIF